MTLTRVFRRPAQPRLQAGLQVNKGLAAYWPLSANTIKANQALDLSGNKNTGTLIGAPPLAPGPSYGTGTSLSLNGFSQCVQIPETPSLDITGTAISYGGWVYPSGQSSYQCIIEKSSSGNNRQYALFLTAGNTSEVLVDLNGVAGSNLSLSSPWVIGAWNHVFVTYDGSNVRVYLNGVVVNTSGVTGSIAHLTSTTIFLGADPPSSAYYIPGFLGPCHVYNRALASAEIYQLYANRRPSFGLVQPRRLLFPASGGTVVTGVGTATGTSTAFGVGASLSASVGTAAGTSSALGVGVSATTAAGVGSAAGSSTASGVGASFAAGTGSAFGTSTAFAISAGSASGGIIGGGVGGLL